MFPRKTETPCDICDICDLCDICDTAQRISNVNTAARSQPGPWNCDAPAAWRCKCLVLPVCLPPPGAFNHLIWTFYQSFVKFLVVSRWCFKMSSWAPFSSPQAPVSRPPAGDQSQMGGYVTNVMIHHMLHVLFYTSLYIISKNIYN